MFIGAGIYYRPICSFRRFPTVRLTVIVRFKAREMIVGLHFIRRMWVGFYARNAGCYGSRELIIRFRQPVGSIDISAKRKFHGIYGE